MGASAGTGAPRNTHKIRTQCGCEYGYKNYEGLVTLIFTLNTTQFKDYLTTTHLEKNTCSHKKSFALTKRIINLCVIINNSSVLTYE